MIIICVSKDLLTKMCQDFWLLIKHQIGSCDLTDISLQDSLTAPVGNQVNETGYVPLLV